MSEIIRFIVCCVLMLLGLVSEVTAVIGVHRFRYSLNRVHAAGIGDTAGVLFVLMAVMVYFADAVTCLKLFAIIVLLWATCPVSAHMIARLESETTDRIKKEAREWKP